MNGYNKSFMADPKGFMEKYCIDIAFDERTLAGQGSGIRSAALVYNFDLSWDPSRTCILLGHANNRRKRVGKDTHLIHAYWLPWVQGRTVSIDLGDEAAFFFTSALDGCRVQVAGNRVAHIAGDLGRSERIRAAQRFEQQSGTPSRRFSSTIDYGTSSNDPKYGFLVGYKRGGSWRYLAQQYRIDSQRQRKLESVSTPALGGTLWDSERVVPDTFV